MTQGITFDTTSGIDLTGWWSNPRTGESFRVIDQFFQDNVLYVRTDKGRIINYNAIQNMVKSDGPIEAPIDISNQPKIDKNALLEGLDGQDRSEMDTELDILNAPFKSTSKNDVQYDKKPMSTKEKKEDSLNKKIIEKAFSKAGDEPTIIIGMEWNWDDLQPVISMLKDTMDIPTSDIVEYLYGKYSEKMIESIMNMLTEYVDHGGTLSKP